MGTVAFGEDDEVLEMTVATAAQHERAQCP